MMIICWIIEFVARVIEMFMCCIFGGTFLANKKTKVSKQLLCVWSVVGALFAALLDRIQMLSFVKSILIILIFLFIQLLTYKIQIGMAILLTLIYSVILTAVDFMIAYFSAFVLGFDVSYLLDTQGLGRVMWILLSKAILILIVITISKIFGKTMIFIKKYITIMCIYSIFLLILLFVMVELNIGRNAETELFLTIFFIASIMIELLMFYFVIKIGEGYEQKRQKELIELKNNMLQKSLDETEQAFRLWRSSVHDYKNNIIVLRQLINDGKIEEVSEYLSCESQLIDRK